MSCEAAATRHETTDEIWTIGHWKCPPDVVVETLGFADIEAVLDIRKVPVSRRSPHFEKSELWTWLDDLGIEYLHLSELAGPHSRQKEIDHNVNAGWRSMSFKRYADYTLTPEFEAGLERLMDLAATQHVAVMCGEPMPWRCHRLLIANTLTARGWKVTHLMNGARPKTHQLGQWGAAPVVGVDGRISYPQLGETT